MTTEYSYKLAVLAPADDWYGANHLAAILGEGREADLHSFIQAMFDPTIAAISTGAKEIVVQAVHAAAAGQFTVVRPEWDVDEIVDVAAAQAAVDNAQYILALDPEDPPVWDGERMLIVLGADLTTVKSVFNLQEIVE